MLSIDSRTPPPNRVELASAGRDIAVVALIGEHDLGHYETLRTVLARAAVRAPSLIVDLSDCVFIDSTTIGVLLQTRELTGRLGGEFALVIDPAPGSVSRLARLAHLDEIFSIQPSLDAATTSIESKRFSDYPS
jgi:anti-anti-sigma factor